MDNLIRLVGAPCQDHTILYLPNDGNGQDDADEVLIILLLESPCPSVTKFRQHHIWPPVKANLCVLATAPTGVLTAGTAGQHR